MSTNIFVKVSRVVEGDTLQAFQVGREFIQLSKAATTLFFDAYFDFADPTPLKFDTLAMTSSFSLQWTDSVNN